MYQRGYRQKRQKAFTIDPFTALLKDYYLRKKYRQKTYHRDKAKDMAGFLFVNTQID